MANESKNEVPAGALEAVKAFFHWSMDEPNEEKAKSLLTKSSRESGQFHMPPESVKAKYAIGEASVEGSEGGGGGGQVWVPVTMTDENTGQSMTMPWAPVLEDGVWKLDMGKMMEKLMGGSLQQMAEQVGAVMGQAMKGVGEALAAGFGGATEAANESEKPRVDAGVLERFEKDKLPRINQQVAKQYDLDIPVDVDVASLLIGKDEEENRRLLDKITDDVLRNWPYAVSDVNRVLPLAGRVQGLRLEGVKSARERVIFAEGGRIIYRLNLVENDGIYDGQTLAEILGGVAVGMAETAPPGKADGRGPSYRPGPDGAKIVKDYREFVEPVLLHRIAEMLGKDLELQVDWDLVAGDAEDAAGLWLWGLNRLCGALGLLLAKPETRDLNRAVLGEALNGVRLLTVPQAGMKAVELNSKELFLYVAPSAGEAGCFYEGQIAEILSRKLKLRTRPTIAELEAYSKTWEKSLEETFGRPINYAFDWDGFTCNDDESKNAFALTLLREHGIDAIYYALTGLAEKNPNFKQQLPQRIKWIYLEHVPRAEKKSVSGEQTTIRLQLYLHEGYDGYLTIKELEKELPGVVAAMPDIAFDERPVEETQAAEETGPSEEEQSFARLRAETDKTLAVFSRTLEPIVGNALPVAIGWKSLSEEMAEADGFIAFALVPIMKGLQKSGSDVWLKSAVGAMLDEVRIQRVPTAAEQAVSLASRILTFSVFYSPGLPGFTPDTVVALMRRAMNVDAVEQKAAQVTQQARPMPTLQFTPLKSEKKPKSAMKKTKPAAKKKTAKAPAKKMAKKPVKKTVKKAASKPARKAAAKSVKKPVKKPLRKKK